MNQSESQHLIELEIKISHQEVAIEELRQALFDQHVTIERMEKSLKQLTDRVQILLEGGVAVGPANQKPPHY